MRHLALAASLMLAPAAAAATADGIAATMREEMERTNAPSLVLGVVRDDELVLVRSFGKADPSTGRDATPETIYEIASLTKVFTATLLVMLRDEGKLGLDDPLSKWLPEAKLPALPGARPVTLRHLATHSAGLPRVPALDMEGPDPWADVTPEALLASLPDLRLLAPPGEAVVYSNLGYALLGMALERASGTTYEKLLRERLLLPLGMTGAGLSWSGAPDALAAVPHASTKPPRAVARWHLGAAAAAGGITCNLKDLARFASLHLKSSRDGVAVVNGWSLRETQVAQRMHASWGYGIGLGWHVDYKKELGEWCWHSGRTGGFTSAIGLAPDHGVAVIVLASSNGDIDAQLTRVMIDAAEVFGRPREITVPADVRRVAADLALAFDERPAERLKAVIHPDFMAARGAQLEKHFRAAWGERGRSARQRFLRPGGAPYRVAFRFADGSELACDMDLSSGRPPRVTGLSCSEGK